MELCPEVYSYWRRVKNVFQGKMYSKFCSKELNSLTVTLSLHLMPHSHEVLSSCAGKLQLSYEKQTHIALIMQKLRKETRGDGKAKGVILYVGFNIIV